MEVPIGFITLYEAVDTVGRALFGASWLYAIPLNPKADNHDAHERITTVIAEGCEAGKISAAYRSIMGADELDRHVWQMPHWRNYFVTGTIDLELPLLVAIGRPDPSGHTARCTREIFVRRDSLDRFIKTLAPAADADEKKPLRPASKEEIRVEIRAVYSEAGNSPPNIRQLPKVVQPRLHTRGLEASENYIAKVGSEPEFNGARRLAGKTIASERPK
jgi:hypothetical protein